MAGCTFQGVSLLGIAHRIGLAGAKVGRRGGTVNGLRMAVSQGMTSNTVRKSYRVAAQCNGQPTPVATEKLGAAKTG